MKVVGVDPGGRNTGLIVREGTGRSVDECLHGEIITRTDDQTVDDYINEIVTAIEELHHGATVAVEDLVAPKGRDPQGNPMVMTVEGLIVAAQVLGAVRYTFKAFVIHPAGFGSAPINCYPPRLIGAREKKGTGKARHARSAWDVAGAHILGVNYANA